MLRTMFKQFNKLVSGLRVIRHSSVQAVSRPINGHYDVIVVGGGPVGLSMACAIAKNPRLFEQRVLLIDAGPCFKGYSQDSFSNRVFAINQSTVDLMKSMDVWSSITGIRHQPVKRMQVWDSSDAMITFAGDDFAKDVAYMVENDVLTHCILKQLEKCPNVTLRNSCKIEAIQLATEENNVGSVKLEGEEHFSCNLLVSREYCC